ncbi:MAG: hypothetical protein HY348_07325 [Nitrospira defluvii]|nr:hypothetical protein [Nitrospira defluvii]
MKPFLVPRSELAYTLALSETRVTELVKSGVLPQPEGRGKFDLGGSVRAYLKHSRSNTRGNLSQERTRLTRAKADREELNLAVCSKELIEVATVEKVVFEKGRQTRDALLSLADRLAGILAPETDQAKVHTILAKEVHQALEALTS